MVASVPERVNPDTTTPRATEQNTKTHTGPISRMLAKVSKWSMEYADYHYERCDWRRMAI